MDLSGMPILRPIPIKTKDRWIIARIWVWITSVRTWRVEEDWVYPLPDDQPRIVVPKGFVFDGASIPRVLWGLLSPTGLLLIPGLIHDFAYRYDYLWAIDESGTAYKYQAGAGQWYWDRMFRRVGIVVNGMAIIDLLAWVTLFLFGWVAWRNNRKEQRSEIFPDTFPIRE